ncbi:MAG: hypothetical protein DRQ65_05575 [Gammaproteobacteria bacterium]|nr:MAG: hypothetical protein DRQ65_05575 [Gammaproteobacteria bacterium]
MYEDHARIPPPPDGGYNLNALKPGNIRHYDYWPEPPGPQTFGNTQVIFSDHEKHMVARIRQADAVFGCMAWLTNYAILDALAGLEAVQIVVQKEDFLRPDGPGWRKTKLLRAYKALDKNLMRFNIPWDVGSCDQCGDPSIEGVRCMGVHNSGRKSASPRMHHKFLVFCHLADGYPEPYAVWTGSFNATWNGTRCRENSMYIESEPIASAYAQEYGTVAALSEPLDWQYAWVAPEWRIGS